MEYGLIGHPLGHSFSKEIHEKLRDYTYEINDIAEERFDKFMSERAFKAINVTIPYKEKVIPYLDFTDDTAREIGAVNTIVNKDGKLYGYNTDIYGITDLINRNTDSIKGKTILILGTGGTSKTSEFAVKQLGCGRIYKATRKADGLKSDEEVKYIPYSSLPSVSSEIEILINTTPVGMFPNTEVMPADINMFTKLEAVIDAVYNPLRTKIVYSARKNGINAESGLFMLVSQAVKAAELFTGDKVSDEKKFSVFNEVLSSRQNIVLIGMPGCGKTTVGKIVAERTGRKFTDTDVLIKEKYGHPSEIITKYGEERFRDIETEIIASLRTETGLIISVGGGAVLRDENIEYLKRNGVTVFIDRDIENIIPTDNRPLSSDREKLEKLYGKRLPIYTAAADFTVKSDENIENTVNKIVSEVLK